MSSLETGLDGKVVLITGASSGIGKYTAIEFSKNNCRLAICGRNAEKLNATAKECSDNLLDPSKVLQVIADLEKETDCKRIVEETVTKFGQLDVVVTSAGILVTGSLEQLSLEDYDRQMNINTRSVFLTLKEAIPHLRKTKGNIVNVSSVTGLRSFPGVMSYCMSKAAVDQLTRCLALEVAPDIRVNAVNPGVIVTNCHKEAGMSEDAYQKFLEHSRATHALGRVGTPDEVAKSIVFLASDKLAGFMTGVTLSVDGGRAVMCPR